MFAEKPSQKMVTLMKKMSKIFYQMGIMQKKY